MNTLTNKEVVEGFFEIYNNQDYEAMDKYIPAFLTKSAIAKARSLTSSGFNPGIHSCSQMTVCC